MIKRILLTAGIIGFAITQSGAAGNNDRLEKIAAAYQQILDQKKDAAPAHGMTPQVERMLLARLRSGTAQNDSVQIEEALLGLSAAIDSEPLRKQCEELTAQLRSEREAKQAKTVAEINAALKHAEETVRTATKASDLDGILQELGKLNARRNEQTSIPISSALNQVEPAIQYVTHWQDFLAYSATGNIQQAREALTNIINGRAMNQPNWIPRSEILAKLQFAPTPAQRWRVERNSEDEPQPPVAPPTVNKPLRYDPSTGALSFTYKKLEDLDGVISALESLKSQPAFNKSRASINSTLETLLPLNLAYKELKAGLATNIPISTHKPDTSTIQNELVAARTELLLLALPRYLGLSAEIKPKANEGPYDFLDRIIREASAKNDYLLAARASETQRLLREGTTPLEDRSQAALFVTANNQEAAGQFALAVVSYEKALAIGTDLIPPKIIGERLAAIKANHPQEFDQGFELYLVPPMRPYAQGFPPGYYPPGYPQNVFPPGGRRGEPQPTPKPTLAVPAVTASPVSSSTPLQK